MEGLCMDLDAYKYNPDALPMQQQAMLYQHLSCHLAYCAAATYMMMPLAAPTFGFGPHPAWYGASGPGTPTSGNELLHLSCGLPRTSSYANVSQATSHGADKENPSRPGSALGSANSALPSLQTSLQIKLEADDDACAPNLHAQDQDLCEDIFKIWNDLGGDNAQDVGELSSIASDVSYDSLTANNAGHGSGTLCLSPRNSQPSASCDSNVNGHILSDLDLDMYIERELGGLSTTQANAFAAAPIDLMRVSSDPTPSSLLSAWPSAAPVPAPTGLPPRPSKSSGAAAAAPASANNRGSGACGLAPAPASTSPRVRGGVKKQAAERRDRKAAAQQVAAAVELDGGVSSLLAATSNAMHDDMFDDTADMLAPNMCPGLSWMDMAHA